MQNTWNQDGAFRNKMDHLDYGGVLGQMRSRHQNALVAPKCPQWLLNVLQKFLNVLAASECALMALEWLLDARSVALEWLLNARSMAPVDFPITLIM